MNGLAGEPVSSSRKESGMETHYERTDTRRHDGRTSSTFVHRVPLVTKRFRYADRSVVYGQAQLFGDRIELRGWQLLGRFTKQIPLEQVVDVSYHPLNEDGNLQMTLDDGEEVKLVMQDAHEWRQHFENWLSYNVLASARLMSERDQARAISG